MKKMVRERVGRRKTSDIKYLKKYYNFIQILIFSYTYQ